MDRELVVSKAREWLGTPWHHQGRVKKVGIDCVGLIVGVARELGVVVSDECNYEREPRFGRLEEELNKYFLSDEREMLQEGDIALFVLAKKFEHVGIVSRGGKGLIHVHPTYEKCLEHIFDKKWRDRLVKVYRWPN